MKINLKTSGLFKKYLPKGSSGNSATLAIPENSTINDLLLHIGAPIDGNYLIIINSNTVPPSARNNMRLNNFDTISLMPPLKGG